MLLLLVLYFKCVCVVIFFLYFKERTMDSLASMTISLLHEKVDIGKVMNDHTLT